MTPDQLPAWLLVKACILTVCVLVAACAESGDIRNVTDYRCNEQQIQNATAQSNACITGGYPRTYCWRTAVHAHCEDMRAKK